MKKDCLTHRYNIAIQARVQGVKLTRMGNVRTSSFQTTTTASRLSVRIKQEYIPEKQLWYPGSTLTPPTLKQRFDRATYFGAPSAKNVLVDE